MHIIIIKNKIQIVWEHNTIILHTLKYVLKNYSKKLCKLRLKIRL